jgi:hypothetical protein
MTAHVRLLIATFDELTGEMQLVRKEDGKVILSSTSPTAFLNGVELLSEQSMVTWLGFALIRQAC